MKLGMDLYLNRFSGRMADLLTTKGIGLDLKRAQRASEDGLELGRPGDHSRRLGNQKWRVLGALLGPASDKGAQHFAPLLSPTTINRLRTLLGKVSTLWITMLSATSTLASRTNSLGCAYLVLDRHTSSESLESIHDRVLSLIMLPCFEVAIVLEAKWQRQ